MLDKIHDIAKKFMEADSTGHDFYHCERVYTLGMRIADTEKCDRLVLGTACYMHDIFRPAEKTKGIHWHVSPEAIMDIRMILTNAGYPAEKLEPTMTAIELHEEYPFTAKKKDKKNNIEGLVLQDADRLDALGAIGIARCLMFAGAYDTPLWIPGDVAGGVYDPTNAHTHAVKHFYEKLLKLKDCMNTKTGRELAEHRHKFMEDYLQEMFREWDGTV